MKFDRILFEMVFRSKTFILYRFRPWDPSKEMRLDESFRNLCISPQNMLLVMINKHFTVCIWNRDTFLRELQLFVIARCLNCGNQAKGPKHYDIVAFCHTLMSSVQYRTGYGYARSIVASGSCWQRISGLSCAARGIIMSRS